MSKILSSYKADPYELVYFLCAEVLLNIKHPPRAHGPDDLPTELVRHINMTVTRIKTC